MKNFLHKIWDFVVNIPKDKLLHYIMGLILLEYSFAPLCRIAPIWLAMVIANMFALVVLFLKELYDFKHPESHSVEVMDIVYGMAGIITGDIALLIQYI